VRLRGASAEVWREENVKATLKLQNIQSVVKFYVKQIHDRFSFWES
jgi:hypothetical protein